MSFNLKKALLMGTAIVAVGTFVTSNAQATELTPSVTITATDAAGVTETDATNTVTLDPTLATTLGADTTPSVVMNSAGNTLTINLTDSSGTEAVTFADDIVETAGDIVLNVTTANTVTFEGDVSASPLTIGSGGADATHTIIFDTANNENLTIDATINAFDAGDVVNIDINNTDTNANTVTFTGAIGGATAATAIDDIDVGTDGNPIDATFANNVNAGTIDLGSGGGETVSVTFGANAATTTVTGVIAAGAGGDSIGVSTAGGSDVTFNSAFGANIDTIQIGTDGTDSTVTFNDNVASGAITIGGGATPGDTNSVTFNTGTTLTVAGTIAEGDAGDTNTIDIAGAGTVTTSGTVDVDTVTVASTATLDADDDVTANIVNNGTLDISSGAAAVTGNVTGAAGVLEVSGTAEIDGNVTQASANVANAAVLSISGDTAATNTSADITTLTFGDADSGLTLDAAAGNTLTYTGDLTGDAGDGDVIFGVDAETETFVFNGNIGASGTAIDDITVGGGTSTADATINGNVYADAVTVNAGDTLTFNGTSVIDDLLGTGTVVVGNGVAATSVTVGDNASGSLTALTVDDNATLVLQNDLTATTFTMDGTTTVQGASGSTWTGATTVGADGDATVNANSQITLGGALNFGDGAGDAIALNVGSNADIDPTAVAAIDAGAQTVTFSAGSVTTLGLSDDQSVATIDAGDTVTWIENAANADFNTEVGDGRIVFEQGLITYTHDTAAANSLAATVGYADAATVFEAGSVGYGVANGLLALGSTGGSTELQAFRTALINGATVAEQQALAESLAPAVDGGFVTAGLQANEILIDANNSRIDVVRGDRSETGLVAGDMGEGLTVWTKAVAELAEQDERDGVDGYDADTYGIAFGIDSENIIDNGILGVSLSYANTEVEADNATTTDTDVDSYQFSVYGTRDFHNDVYVSGTLSYARNNIDQTRHNVGQVAGNNASADFDSDQYMAYAEVGKNYAFDGVTITPRVLANYTHVEFDSYTETGSTANLTVSTEDVDIFELGVGVSAEWDLEDGYGNKIVPSLMAEYRYDFIEDEVDTTSTFTGTNTAFRTEGFEPAQSTFIVGTGIAYDISDRVTLSADYGYEFKEDYDSHNVAARAAMKF